MEEVPFTGFEVIHPPTGTKDFVVAALKAGITPTEIAAFVGSSSDEVAAILNISSSSSTREIEVEATKERSSKRYSPPMSPISSLECKRRFDGGDDDDDELSIVSSVTNVKTMQSVYSHECSVFTEMHYDHDLAINDNFNAHQNKTSDANAVESTGSNSLQRRRNRFARKVLKRLSSLPLVTELETSVHSEQSPIVTPKRKRFAAQALMRLSILRKSNISSDKKIPSDASTAASTQATEENSKVSSSSQSSMNSSITISTADFDENPNPSDLDNLAFQSYLFTTPWDAAKSGDYATLNYIANNEDESDDVWTKQDVSGNVPLYYACVHGGNFGKYGLESVKLMLNVWPEGDVPNNLLKRCLKETENKAVKKILKDKMGRGSGLFKVRRRSSTVLEGTEKVTPQSFLDDLGDDGYVEDY
eukprot:scaffold19_cov95-Skeletonema_dohrnii-CCMP3373.AAC.2